MARAERIITEELGRLGWTEEQLHERRRSDPAKLALATRLRRETTQTVGLIAARLQMGTRKSAAVKLHRWDKERHPTHYAQANGLTPVLAREAVSDEG